MTHWTVGTVGDKVVAELASVVVVTARCKESQQTFGIRLEQRSEGHWIADWAFGLREAVARKEGYGPAGITGTFRFADAYPGCPHCRARSIFKCSCEKISCWNGEQRNVVCAWCGATIQLDREIDALTVVGDR